MQKWFSGTLLTWQQRSCFTCITVALFGIAALCRKAPSVTLSDLLLLHLLLENELSQPRLNLHKHSQSVVFVLFLSLVDALVLLTLLRCSSWSCFLFRASSSSSSLDRLLPSEPTMSKRVWKSHRKDACVPAGCHAWCVLQLVVQRQRGMVWLHITKRNTQIMKEATKHKWRTKLRRQTGSSELKWHDRFPLPCHYFSGSQRQGETDQYNAGQTDRQQFEVSPGFLCPSLWPWLLVMLITACKKM